MKTICVTEADGSTYWLLEDGTMHREDGPAVIRLDGKLAWYIKGEGHREDGPATIYPDGTQTWNIHNRLHRIDGPAVISPRQEPGWYLNGHRHSFNEWLKRTPVDDEQKLLLKLQYG